jgi:hypothetical protein
VGAIKPPPVAAPMTQQRGRGGRWLD